MTKEIEMKYRGKYTGHIYTLVFQDEDGVLMKSQDEKVGYWCTKSQFEDGDLFEEYREPVIVKGVRKVVLINNEISTRPTDYWGNDKYVVGSVEFTVTDGKLTKAHIL